jgi:TetR/AcrR family transcriptional regulator
MSETHLNTEQQILQSAEELFLEKGFSNTSTTEIAKRAGCNQALVHYYFRTKENLFQQIFIVKIELFLKTFMIEENEGDFFTKMERRIGLYFDMLSNNRKLPFLILNELVLSKERRDFIRENFIKNEGRQQIYYMFDKEIQNEIIKGTIRPIETFDLLINVVSLTIFTFLSLPIVGDVLEKNKEEKNEYILHRKKEVIDLIIRGIKADN